VERDIFHTQLRAILRASAFGNVSIMFPMISEVRELRLARAALLDAENELREEGIEIAGKVEVGAMIEVPSAALVMEGLTPMAEFFSIGTNDLIQYTVAADRGNEKTAYLYDPLHPGVLRLIKGVVDCAHAAGRRVCVCGEMAAGIEFTLVLAGLMVDQLSMSPIAIPEVKRLIRSINFEDAVLAAHQVLAMTEPEKIRETILRRTVELAPWTADFLSVGTVSSN
jgi:phosphotransferase system enzyme I (PtsI)